MMEHVNWIHNIPFFSIFLAMFCGIITPLIKNGKTAHKVHALMVLIVAIMSAILLVNVTTTGESFTFMMGHFPAPWGNELRAGPLEAMMALIFSVVMLLTTTGGQEFIFHDVVPEKQSFYFIMLNALFGSMLALAYTWDPIDTAPEINSSVILQNWKDSNEAAREKNMKMIISIASKP